jgi:hypothetical protein
MVGKYYTFVNYSCISIIIFISLYTIVINDEIAQPVVLEEVIQSRSEFGRLDTLFTWAYLTFKEFGRHVLNRKNLFKLYFENENF